MSYLKIHLLTVKIKYMVFSLIFPLETWEKKKKCILYIVVSSSTNINMPLA